MAKRKKIRRGLSKKKPSHLIEMTRIKLLYGLSGIFTLAVAGLLLARPAPLAGNPIGGRASLSAQTQDALDSAIQPDSALATSGWKKIVVSRANSLGTAAFHFAVLPQATGDQIAISAEWSRQAAFESAPGELQIVLINPDETSSPHDVKTITQLVERLSSRLQIRQSDIVWR